MGGQRRSVFRLALPMCVFCFFCFAKNDRFPYFSQIRPINIAPQVTIYRKKVYFCVKIKNLN